ncbi:hypothetical protein Taro_025166 [Colocasia esculenta]|uniref:CID domain-containing protein n=1 Tax=Colocasia esculenta TaxID=4460 RepID=A0A843V2J4_COLES|nr:hypothetical protein [Colocasia esculenta]
MEMESSRRSLDRSKEPGLLKKPRLAEAGERDPRLMLGAKGAGAERDRAFLPRGGPAGGGMADPAVSRFRANERERELDQTAPAYRGTSSYQQQQMQELAAQYKTALAELTFNSKPIITNLTIIAGENLHAAKAIAAIVCANILEVPSEQKLPSLYLLDSIVKNIGRDYIKYFAAKLPEVFCKAYKQVDSSIHPGMRHLFGTWKGVFPSAPLMIIEKELDFPSVINGSSSGGGSRPDSQAQRPPHSIHVNPKYLEARQQLQQPSRVKGVGAVSTNEDVERPVRVPLIGGSRQWADQSIKNLQQPQRELSNESVREKNPGPGYGDQEFVSDYSRHSDSGILRTSGRYTEHEVSKKPWGTVGRNSHEAPFEERNGSDANHAYGNYVSGQTSIQPSSNRPNATNKSSIITSQNWKNSEEEEYMWDDVNSRLMDPGISNTSSWSVDDSEGPTTLRRAKRTVPKIEHLESKWNKLDTLSQLGKAAGKEDRVPSFRGTEGHIPVTYSQHDSGPRADREPSADALSTGGSILGQQAPGLWSSQTMKSSLGGLDHVSSRISGQQEGCSIPGSDEVSTSMDVSFPKMGRHFSNSSVGSGSLVNPASAGSGMVERMHQLPLRSPSPSADLSGSSALLQPQNLHNTADCDHLKPQKPIQFPGQLKRAVPSQVTPDSFSLDLQNDIQQTDSLPNPQQLLSKISQSIKMSSVSSTFPQVQHHLPFLQQSESDLPMQQIQRESHPSIYSQEQIHPPLSFGSTQANGSGGMSNSINSDGDVLDQSSASKLLAAIMKSGLISSTPVTSLENLIIQPPLPSGPPPVQVMSAPPSSGPFSTAPLPIPHGGYTQTPAIHPSLPVLPPLPPGPPPPSSLVGTSSQVTNTASTNANPLSSLLSSLVAKGLISSTGTKLSDPANVEMPSQPPNRNLVLPASTSMPLTTAAFPTVPLTLPSSEPPRAESSSSKGDVSSKAVTEEVKGLLGLQFKPEVVREFHPFVIDCLYENLEHQCNKCGLRFKAQEEIHRHFDWHASKSEISNFDRVSRKWYANSDEWVVRHAETLHGSMDMYVEMTVSNPEKCEPMVPADENQCVCALCGEPFEDFYCEQRDEWMYKGTVYMNPPARERNMQHMDKQMAQGPIVHAKCISTDSSHEFAVPIDKMWSAVHSPCMTSHSSHEMTLHGSECCMFSCGWEITWDVEGLPWKVVGLRKKRVGSFLCGAIHLHLQMQHVAAAVANGILLTISLVTSFICSLSLGTTVAAILVVVTSRACSSLCF